MDILRTLATGLFIGGIAVKIGNKLLGNEAKEKGNNSES